MCGPCQLVPRCTPGVWPPRARTAWWRYRRRPTGGQEAVWSLSGTPTARGRGARQGGRGGDLPKWRGINEGHGAWTGDGVPSPVRSSGGRHRRGTVLQHRGMEGEVRCTENQIHSPRRSSSPRRGRFWWRRLQLQRGGGSSTTGLDKR
jgi:hypothetical protein